MSVRWRSDSSPAYALALRTQCWSIAGPGFWSAEFRMCQRFDFERLTLPHDSTYLQAASLTAMVVQRHLTSQGVSGVVREESDR